MSQPLIAKMPHVGTRRFRDHLCLINQERREAWVWSGVSAWLWENIARGISEEDLSHRLAQRFSVSSDTAVKDVSNFVEALRSRGFISSTDTVSVPAPHGTAHNVTGRMHTIAYEQGVLFRAWIDLLVPCNLRCRHCYLDFSHKEVVPFSNVLNWLDQLSAHGCPDITLTGGEIFLRKDITDIISACDERGFLFDLFTNANFIDEPIADTISGRHITTVQVSLYGTTAETHEMVTRKPGTFEKSVRAIRLLRERDVPVRIAFHVQRDNFEDAFRMPEFASKLDAECEFDAKLVPNRNGSLAPLDFGINVQQQAELYRSGLIEKKTTVVCPAARSKIRITAAGDVLPCQLINTVTLGNLNTETLSDIWSGQHRERIRQDILGYKPVRCTTCSHTDHCSNCAAMRGYNLTESHLTAPVSEACLMTAAHLLADDLLLPEHIQADDCLSLAMQPATQFVQIQTN